MPNAKLPKAKVVCIRRISPSLKLTLPLRNRFLPLQESTNTPATHEPLTPEMRPDKKCGQRPTMIPSPERRAVHASANRALLSPEMRPDGRCGQRRNKNQSPWRAQVEKKRDYSLPHTSTLPLSDTQIADSPQTLKRDNSLPDAMDTCLATTSQPMFC
ncbi:unnamed protein product [Boreogadus saida]